MDLDLGTAPMPTVLKHLATTLGRGLGTGRTESQDYLGCQGVSTGKPTWYGSRTSLWSYCLD